MTDTMAVFVLPDQTRARVWASPSDGGVELPSLVRGGPFHPSQTESLNAEATSLLRVPARISRHVTDAPCDVFEIAVGDVPRAGGRWVATDAVFGPSDATALGIWASTDQSQPAWERPGWFEEAMEWAATVLGRMGCALIEAVPVKSGWPCSTVIRLDTSEGRLFFKAVSPKPPSEPDVLVMLARRGLKTVPVPVAVDSQRRWMVTRGHSDVRPSRPKDVLAAFAALQLDVSNDILSWTQLGTPCVDGGLLLNAFVDAVDVLPADRDSRRVLDNVALQCERFASSPIAKAVVHQDLRDENVAAGDTLLFFDWADVVISHPFFSAIRYLDFHGCSNVQTPADVPAHLHDALQAYLRPFVARYGDAAVRRDLVITWSLQGVFMLVRWRRELSFVEPRSPWARKLASFTAGEWKTRVLSRLGSPSA